MEIKVEDVGQAANKLCLPLTEQEVKEILPKLNLAAYAKVFKNMNIEGVGPMTQVHSQPVRLREDTASCRKAGMEEGE